MILFIIARFLLFVPYRLIFWVRVKGRENLPKRGAVIVSSSHIHLLDPITHAAVQSRPFYSMAKEELFRNRFFAGLLKLVGAFPVRRGHRDKAAIENALSLLDNGKMIVLYPEGTRSKTGQLQEYKPGVTLMAHHADVPIVPAVIIAKHGYIPFCGIKVIYGKPVTTKELGIKTGGSKELRDAAAALRDISVQMLAEEKVI
jgi:1-acyl-sn-glycerol-3-phosphate acyltransferase